MTWAEALANYQECRWEEGAAGRDVLFANAEQLRELAAAKRSTANALDVLASFAIDGER